MAIENSAPVLTAYAGRLTMCHAYAALGAFSHAPSDAAVRLFDLASTVPFGITLGLDKSRQLQPLMDPDLGLDLAFRTLNIEFQTVYWPTIGDAERAIELLEDWASQGPILLGPLDMGELPYYEHPWTLKGCDHYLAVLDVHGDSLRLSDSEGLHGIWIPLGEILTAWAGQGIPEGRGAFTLRRASPFVLGHFGTEMMAVVAANAYSNLVTSLAEEALTNYLPRLSQSCNTPATRRGLLYNLSALMQRLDTQGILCCLLSQHCLISAKESDVAIRQLGELLRQFALCYEGILHYQDVRSEWKTLASIYTKYEEDLSYLLKPLV